MQIFTGCEFSQLREGRGGRECAAVAGEEVRSPGGRSVRRYSDYPVLPLRGVL